VISNFFSCIFGEYILCVYTLLVFFNEKIQVDIDFNSLSLLPLSKYKSEEKSVENAEYAETWFVKVNYRRNSTARFWSFAP